MDHSDLRRPLLIDRVRGPAPSSLPPRPVRRLPNSAGASLAAVTLLEYDRQCPPGRPPKPACSGQLLLHFRRDDGENTSFVGPGPVRARATLTAPTGPGTRGRWARPVG